MFNYIQSISWTSNAVESIVLVLMVLILRSLLLFSLNQTKIRSADLLLRWKVQIRTLCLFIIVLGLLFIWASELRDLALSMVAFGVAIIIAIKELITCLTGSLLKVTAGSFTVGDRIIVGDVRGDVIDQSLLTTTILEIGPGKDLHQLTGRALTLPNSLFLNVPVINESFNQDYVLHSFTIPLKLNHEWKTAEKVILEAANEVCAPYFEEAKNHFRRLAKKRSFDVPPLEPRTTFSVSEPDRINMIIRIPAPFRQKGRVEQEILKRFLERHLAIDPERTAETVEA